METLTVISALLGVTASGIFAFNWVFKKTFPKLYHIAYHENCTCKISAYWEDKEDANA